MTRPAAFVGVLAATWPGIPGQPMLVQVALPRDAYDPLHRGVGFPRWPEGPNVALLACERPVHPRRDADALALATARALNGLLADGAVQLAPELLRELGALSAAIGAVGLVRRRDLAAPPPARAEAP